MSGIEGRDKPEPARNGIDKNVAKEIVAEENVANDHIAVTEIVDINNGNEDGNGDDEDENEPESFTKQTWVVWKVIGRRARFYKVLWDTGETTWEPCKPDICRTGAFAVWLRCREIRVTRRQLSAAMKTNTAARAVSQSTRTRATAIGSSMHTYD